MKKTALPAPKAKGLRISRTTGIDIISSLFILLFVYTAISKLYVFKDVKIILKEYPLIGGVSDFVAWSLPISELVIALFLFIPRLRLLGLYGALALMTAFTAYLAYMLSFTTKLPCTCGGFLKELGWPQHLIFNIHLAISKTDKRNNY
jgi:putative oxidoreductase